MNCQLKTIVDSSSLYKNNVVIKRASVTFVIQKCNDVRLSINCNPVCFMGREMKRVCFNVRNNGNQSLQNAILRISINPYYSCCGCSCFNTMHETFCINCLQEGENRCFCINLPLKRCLNFKVVGQVIANSAILQEESITI